MSGHLLSKVIQSWVLPPGFLIIWLLIGLLLINSTRVSGRFFLLTGILALWLLSVPEFVYFISKPLQGEYPVLTHFLKPKEKSAILVLGGGVRYAPEYQLNVPGNETAVRLEYAYYLWKRLIGLANEPRDVAVGGGIPVIVSGGFNDNLKESESNVMARVLTARGVRPVFQESLSINTQDEARKLKSLINQQGFRHIYLVTNAWHMTRSMELFRREFKGMDIDFIAAPTGFFEDPKKDGFLAWMPSAKALWKSEWVIHEYLGILLYRLSAQWNDNLGLRHTPLVLANNSFHQK